MEEVGSESHLICGLRHGASGLSWFHIVQKLLTQIHGMHDFPPTGHVQMHEMQIPFHLFLVHVFN